MNKNIQTGDLSTGSSLGRYRILGKIGAGGMGEVYLAEDASLGRKVALKTLFREVIEDDGRMQRFMREAMTASSLSHPNIVTVYEIGEAEGKHYIATEYVEGETLRRHLQRGLSDLQSTLDIAVQLAGALDAAHHAGIIHRDIKPENVMIRPDGLVKLLDFGIAKICEPSGAGRRPEVGTEASTALQPVTRPGLVIGTAAYMSPEQARGQPVDARSDIFSFGAVLYEMLTGRPAFEGENDLDVIGAILNRAPLPLGRSSRPHPRELEHILEKCLRRDREERYQSSRDLLIDLKDLRQELELESKLRRASQTDEESASAATAGAATETSAGAAGADYLTRELKQHKTATLVILVILLAAIAGGGLWLYDSRPSGTAQIDSIAVLPFQNASGDPNLEYLSDGLAESLINSLSELQQLKVTARATAFRYKDRELDPPAAGRELNVRAVLTGRVRQLGDQLNIQVDLVDAATGTQLWGERYNRKASDILEIQEEIAREIISRLSLRLSGGQQDRAIRRPTESAEAYRLYLKGRFYWNKRTEENVNKGIELFQQAIEKDPNFALAYVGLADSYILLGVPEALTGALPTREALAKARAAAEKALAIDDSLAEAHASLGHARFTAREWTGAEEAFRRSFALNQNYATAHHWYSLHLTNSGRFDEALGEISRAQELDPLSLPINTNVAFVLFAARRYDEAAEQAQKAIEMDPTFALARQRLGVALEQKGMYREAITQLGLAVAYSNRHPNSIASLAHACAASGDTAEARRLLGELTETATQRYVAPYDIAIVHVGLGDKEQAFRWLQAAVEQQDYLNRLNVDPRFDPLRSEPGYAELVRRIRLKP